MRPRRKLIYTVSAKDMMWCRDNKKWISFYLVDKPTYPKGATSHKYFHTVNRAWRHVFILERKGIEYQLVRYEKKASGRLSTVWTTRDYYTK